MYGTCDPWCAGAGHKGWSCRKHGGRTCSWPTENCKTNPVGHTIEHPCCSIPGMACFEKDASWGDCRTYCNPEEVDNTGKKWSCKKLGGGRPVGGIMVSKAPLGKVANTSLFCVMPVMPIDEHAAD